jgi:hypothetical protein
MFYSNNLGPPLLHESKPGRGLLVICFLAFIMILGCSSDNAEFSGQKANPVANVNSEDPDFGEIAFNIQPKYSYIRSYPGGGGIFIVRLLNTGNFPGGVSLLIHADPNLHAVLSRETLSGDTSMAEITVRPDLLIETGGYELKLTATNIGNSTQTVQTQIIYLKVEVLQWGPANPDNVIPKRDDFIDWLETVHPELGDFSNRVWYPYMTYPQIWIVEHWTFLDEDWEFRLCYHVMIPPYDWSMIMLRRRGEWNPVLAAMRESDGTIREIPVSEYPIMYGY